MSIKHIKKAFKEKNKSRSKSKGKLKRKHSKSGSQTSKLNTSRAKNEAKEKILRDIYTNPIKIIQMKVDNTYDYRLPPFFIEAF